VSKKPGGCLASLSALITAGFALVGVGLLIWGIVSLANHPKANLKTNTTTASAQTGSSNTPNTTATSTVTTTTASVATTTTKAPLTTQPPSSQSGGTLSLFVEPTAGLSPIYSLLSSGAGAGDTVDMTMYELSDTRVVTLLCSDHRAGASVSVLLDKAYHGGSYNQNDASALSSCGVNVHWASTSVIFHQKTITVVTSAGAKSLIMSMNLTSRYYSTTRDYVIEDSKKGDTSAILAAFNGDIASGVPQSASAGTDLIWSPGSQGGLVSLINEAASGSTLLVENEELSASGIISALESDARRGVHVDLCLQKTNIEAQTVSSLEGAGVAVHLSDTSNLYIHAKAISVNNSTVYVGSINFSTTSMNENRELGIVTQTASVVSGVTATLAKDFANS